MRLNQIKLKKKMKMKIFKESMMKKLKEGLTKTHINIHAHCIVQGLDPTIKIMT